MIKLPDEAAFATWQSPDAQTAWEHFAGLTIDEAYTKFCDDPQTYQEDFMYMGVKAFAYYAPVLQRYINEAEPVDKYDDCCLWILGCGLEIQLNENPQLLKAPIGHLTDLLLNRLKTSKINNEDKKRIAQKWKEIRVLIVRT